MGSVLVTGATGFLGTFIVSELLANGQQVRVLARRTDHPALQQWIDQVEVYVGDVTDPATLEAPMRGTDAVIHGAALVSLRRRDQARLRQVNAQGTAHVVNTALEAGVHRLVYVSSVAALGRREGRPPDELITEDARWTPSALNTYYGKTKQQGEREVARGVEEGLAAVILNPAIILGPGSWNAPTPAIIHYLARRQRRWVPGGANGWVGAEDVARACFMALHSPHNEAERFILVSENLSYKQVLGQMASAVGRRPPQQTPPRGLVWLTAWLAEHAASSNSDNPLTLETARITAAVSRYDNTRFRQAFQFEFEPISQVVARMAQTYLKDHTSGV